ncbi:MAG: sulfotransferase [Acidobacteria bacterium]|nr:sulfotransferase [Acidobacteriota bacterium]
MNSIHNISRPIFIVGAPRSGTTMLQFRLRNHPRIAFPTGESHFIVPLCRDAAKFGDLSQLENIRKVLTAMHKQSAEFLDTDLHGIPFDIEKLAVELHRENRYSMPAIISGIFEQNATALGKARWGDKTPYYVLHMTKLLQWFSDAQIIHIIRDGRDVALSLFGRRHDFRVYNTYRAAKYWQHYVNVGCETGAKLNPNVYMEIHYEDVLREPASTLKKICAFLQEDYDDGMFAVRQAELPGKTPLVHEPIKKENKEKWRHKMTQRQIRIFESVAGKELEKLGYPCLTKPRILSFPIRALYHTHNLILDSHYKRSRRDA